MRRQDTIPVIILLIFTCASAQQYAFRIDADMPQLTKDVRPRPMIDWMEKRTKQKSDKNAKSQPEIESSGSPLWDDEDGYEEGSGSGLPPIIDNRPNIQFTKDHPKNIDLSITHSRGPSVVVNDFETIPQRPDSASSLGFMITIIVTFYMFFF